jgi:hypothetical protein
MFTCVADEIKKKEEEADFVCALALKRTAFFAALLIILKEM